MTAPLVPMLLGGRLIESRSEETEPIPDPATGETIAILPHSTREEIDRAVAAAREAWPAWAETAIPERAAVMFRYRTLLEEHFEELSLSVVRENGKTLDEARGEVRRGLEVVDMACGAPLLLRGTNLDQIAPGIDEELVRFPVGVVAGITPFNFPAMVPLWMFPLAIVAGNSFVLKPSQRTPLTAVRLAELLRDAGLPEGVIQVVHGARMAVEALIAHPDVAAISFVGSAGVARGVYAEAAANGKRVQALGGAKNHLVVMGDADLDATTTAILSSAFGNAGQRCLAGSVVVGVGEVGDELVGGLARSAGGLKVGPGTDPATDVGPVIREERRKELIQWIDRGREEGAVLVRDGREQGPPEGFFLGPTILDRVTPGMELWRTELFGPILSVTRAEDLDRALDVVNASPYGNAASIFTSSGRAAREFRRRVEAGMVGVNIGIPAPMAFFPFTGWKGSFFGDLHATGEDAVRFYTRPKVVTTRWSATAPGDRARPEGRGH